MPATPPLHGNPRWRHAINHWPDHEDRDFGNSEALRRVDELLRTGACPECGAKDIPDVEPELVGGSEDAALSAYKDALAKARQEFERQRAASKSGGGA